jgi:phenylacetate-CoA ligase
VQFPPLDKLKDVYRRAQRTAFYANRLPEEMGDWARLPLTTKEDLRQTYPLGLLGVPIEKLATYHESSGTSGSPISSFFTENDWLDIQNRFLRSRVGLGPRDMVFVKTPYSLVTTAHQMHGAARLVGATVVPADNRSRNMPYRRVLRLLKDLPITVTWCLPTEALIWAYLARQMGLDPAQDFPHLRALMVAGEALSPARREAISQLWGGRPVIEDYGSTETGSLAGECSHGQLHLWSDRLHFEILDGTSQTAVLEGRGSLVVTPLEREAMPLVRYHLEDEVRIFSTACPCGSTSPRLEVFGRKLARTSGLYPRDLEEVIFRVVPQTWFWRARASAEAIEVEVHVAHSPCAARKSLQEAIESAFGRRALVRPVNAACFVAPEWLRAEEPMQKPRFVFGADENWNNSAVYF